MQLAKCRIDGWEGVTGSATTHTFVGNIFYRLPGPPPHSTSPPPRATSHLTYPGNPPGSRPTVPVALVFVCHEPRAPTAPTAGSGPVVLVVLAVLVPPVRCLLLVGIMHLRCSPVMRRMPCPFARLMPPSQTSLATLQLPTLQPKMFASTAPAPALANVAARPKASLHRTPPHPNPRTHSNLPPVQCRPWRRHPIPCHSPSPSSRIATASVTAARRPRSPQHFTYASMRVRTELLPSNSCPSPLAGGQAPLNAGGCRLRPAPL